MTYYVFPANFIYGLILFYCIICRWLSSKEIHKEDIKYWRREILRLMCEIQKNLPSTFFNAQEHYLIHQVEEIELCGPIHSRPMWMVERHLNIIRFWLGNEHVQRVLWWSDIWYTRKWCILLNVTPKNCLNFWSLKVPWPNHLLDILFLIPRQSNTPCLLTQSVRKALCLFSVDRVRRWHLPLDHKECQWT